MEVEEAAAATAVEATEDEATAEEEVAAGADLTEEAEDVATAMEDDTAEEETTAAVVATEAELCEGSPPPQPVGTSCDWTSFCCLWFRGVGMAWAERGPRARRAVERKEKESIFGWNWMVGWIN